MIIYIAYNSMLTRLLNHSNLKILKFIVFFSDEGLTNLSLSFFLKTKFSFNMNVVFFHYRVYISKSLIFENYLI